MKFVDAILAQSFRIFSTIPTSKVNLTMPYVELENVD